MIKENNKVFIASDHGGFELKRKILQYFRDSVGNEFIDLGPYTLDPNDDYPDFAFLLAERVSLNPKSMGILICRSGNGMVISANKVDGAYAALCLSAKHAQMAKIDDNANIICLMADYKFEDPIKITESFINTNFSKAERHVRRFRKIVGYEEQREQFYLNSNPRIAIRALITNNSKVLLVKNTNDGYFYLPGGKVEMYESIQSTIERELSEELSIKVEITLEKLLKVSENVNPGKGKHKVDIIYLAKINKSKELEGVRDPNHGGLNYFTWQDPSILDDTNDGGNIREILKLI